MFKVSVQASGLKIQSPHKRVGGNPSYYKSM